MPWVDHVRTFVILLVVNMHACVTYSHVGDWYIVAQRDPTMPEKIPFIVWQGMLQAFFMGLLFFVSGYFAHGSIQRRGPAAFVRERLVRLGVPTLFYMLLVHPFVLLVLNPWHHRWGNWGTFYAQYLRTGRFLASSGPLWFAFALLLFCLGFAAVRARRTPSETAATTQQAPPGRKILALAIALGLTTFLVRTVQPIGTNLLNFQLCFFPQYVVGFTLGIAAARDGWLSRLVESKAARVAGWLGALASPPVLIAILAAGGSGGPEPFVGGWHWPAFALAMWEQACGVGLALGVMAWFSARMNRVTNTGRWLSERSFAVYVLHPPVVVALTMAFWNRWENPYGMAALLTVTGWLGSFLIADLARRLPLVRRLF